MRTLAIDPGYRNCGFIILEDLKPINFGGFHEEEGDVFDRSYMICQCLQKIAVMYEVDLVVTETYYANGKLSNPRTNHGRGVFDGLLHLALAHVPMYKINPTLLKKFVTTSTKAKKELVVIELIKMMEKWYGPDFYERIRQAESRSLEHITEAWGLGLMGYYMFNSNFKHDNMKLKPHQIVVLNRTANAKETPLVESLLAQPIELPTTYQQL